MNYYKIKEAIIHGEKIYNLPLRVTYYARVSTDSDIQLNSLDNQTSYYTNLIKSNPNWTFIEGYIEEGVSGVRVDKRTSFKKMLYDAKLNKFDLIITKEVSRFARDLEDSIHYIRELKANNVGVFFENQNLNTFDDNSELILNIMFNLAQDESKKLSKRVKFGHHEAIKCGHVLGSSNITGYKKDNCKLVIVEEEAKFIRKIFELYATGEYGFYRLAKKLGELGFYNKKGRLYDKDSLKRMISNPKYKGFYRGHTYEIIDYRTKKRKKIPLEDQTLYKCSDGSIPSIVSEELWNKANEILKNRTENYQKNNYWSGGLKYPFSSKIYCKEHNTNFGRSHGSKKKNKPTWSCNLYLHYGLTSCYSPIILEKDLYLIMKKIFNIIIPNKDIIIKDMTYLYNNINYNEQYNIKLQNIEDNILKIENKKSIALDLIITGDLKHNELKKQFKHFENEISLLLKQKKDIINQIKTLNNNINNKEKISKYIQEELDGKAKEEFIRYLLDEIIVSKINNNRNNIQLDIYLNFFDNEKERIKGSKYINRNNDEMLYLKNQHFSTINKLNSKKNNYIYNVYIKK